MSVSRFGRWMCLLIGLASSLSLGIADPGWSQDLDVSGQPAQVEFQGNHHFPSTQLERALLGEADYLLARHPRSPREALREITDRLLTDGYRNEGFADVEVLVTDGRKPGTLLCQITEGPRYVGGSVRIEGAKQLDEERLVQRLTQPFPPANSIPEFQETGASVETVWLNKDGKPAKLEDPVFQLGEPISFDREDALRKSVETALKEMGYSRALPLVRLEKRNNSTMDLVVSIADEGAPNVIRSVTVKGAPRHGSDRVVEFLGLRAGQTLDRSLEVNLRRKLWESGRFSKHDVSFVPATGEVSIAVTEVAGVPLLDEPLDDFAQVMLRTRTWLLFCDENHIDTSFTFTGPENDRIEVIVSSAGAFAQVTSSTPGPSSAIETVTVLADENDFVLDQSSQPDLYRIQLANVGGQLSFQTMLGPAEEEDRTIKNRFTINGTTDRENGQPGVKLQWTVSPAQMLGLAYKPNLKKRIEAETLLLSCPTESLSIQIDRSTGAILSWTVKDGTIQFGKGLLLHARAEFLAAIDSKPNSMRRDSAISTLTAYVLSDGMLRGIQRIYALSETPFEMPAPHALSGVRKIVDSGLLTIPDAIVVWLWSDHKPSDPFVIPMGEPKANGVRSMLTQLVASAILRVAPHHLPENGWPMKVTREACLVAMGRGKYAGPVLQELILDDENGPLCHAAVAYLLNLTKQNAQNAFASRSLMTLTPERFAKDYAQLAPLLRNDLVMKTLASLQPLTQPELDAILNLVEDENLRNILELAAHHPLDQPRDQSDFWFRISSTKLKPWLETMIR